MKTEGDNPLGKGFVHVYTGNGKGKTTAALGLAFRAMGHKTRTYVGQFMKGQSYGELEAAKMVQPYITFEQYGKETFIHIASPPKDKDIRDAQIGLTKAKKAMLSGKFSIVVLDEIITANHFRLVSVKDMLDFIDQKPDGVELIFTGRYAPAVLVDAADLVTEMKEIKHYFAKGIGAREGIER